MCFAPCKSENFISCSSRPGGLFLHGMTEHYTRTVEAYHGLEAYMERMEREGVWTRVRREVVPGTGAVRNPGLFHVYRKN